MTSDATPGVHPDPTTDPSAELTEEQRRRYARQIVLPEVGEAGQLRLLRSSVVVVGAGGLGCPVLASLAGAGVGRITVIDDDRVALENLHRQPLYDTASQGELKAATAADAVVRLNPDVRVTPVAERLTDLNAAALLGGHDVIVDGTDNFATRYLVSDTGVELQIPVVWGAVLGFDAQVSTFPPGGPTLRDLFPVLHEVPSCAAAGVLGSVPAQAGAIMATEVLTSLLGIGPSLTGRVLVIDAVTQRTRELPLRARATSGTPATTTSPQARVPVPAAATPEVSPDRLRELLQGADPPVLLDVREPHEHQAGHLPGSRSVPVAQALAWRRPQDVGAASVVVYCHSGARAQRVGAHLISLGLHQVSVLAGGMAGWPDPQSLVSGSPGTAPVPSPPVRQ